MWLAGYDYTLTLASSFYTFNPQEFKNLLNDQTASFTGTLRYYTVGGIVTDENHNPLSGIIVALYRSAEDLNISVDRKRGLETASTRVSASGWWIKTISLLIPSMTRTVRPDPKRFPLATINQALEPILSAASLCFPMTGRRCE